MASLPEMDDDRLFTGMATPPLSLEPIQCSVFGCDARVPRVDLPVHLAHHLDHLSRMSGEFERQRRGMLERIEDLEREKVCLEEEMRLVKQESRTQVQQAEYQTQRDLQQIQQVVRQTQDDLQQTQEGLEQTQGGLEQTQRNLEQTQDNLEGTQCDVEQLQHPEPELQHEGRRIKLMSIIVALFGLVLAILPVFLVSDNHLSAIIPVNITVPNFWGLKKAGDSWFGEPFYTHFHGYKVCVVVWPGGAGKNSTGHVSVGIRLMRGEFDDYLYWPFHGNIIIQLLDKSGTIKTFIIDYPDRLGSKVTTGEMADRGWGLTQFITHDDLELYLQDDSLQIQITEFQQNIKQWQHEMWIKQWQREFQHDPLWQVVAEVRQRQCKMWHNLYTDHEVLPVSITADFNGQSTAGGWSWPYEWWSSQPRQLKAGAQWISKPFYTHPCGYKVCLVVRDQGEVKHRQCNVTIISVEIRLMPGEFDKSLSWPFHGGVIIKVLDKRGRYRSFVIDCSDSTLGGRVTDGEMAERGWGAAWSFTPSELELYLPDDTLQLRVTQFEQNGTFTLSQEHGMLKKDDIWPEVKDLLPVNISMKEFGSYRENKTKWYSDPFYTHFHGYKMCLSVYANGRGKGEGRHVSVFFCLMHGEFDGDLKWPCRVALKINVLNVLGEWKDLYTINFKQIDGGIAPVTNKRRACWGKTIVLSHTELESYLDKGSMLFKVI